jgi:hypothetical protein
MSNVPPFGLFGLTMTAIVVPAAMRNSSKSKAKSSSGSSRVSL